MQFPNFEGQTIPKVSWNLLKNNQWTSLCSDDIFKGKRVILFGLPGAFSTTCSFGHLPGYEELYTTFKKAANIDDVVCVSVNDPFVMNEWAKDQGIQHVTMIPDGNCEFTEKLGFAFDLSPLNLGRRSWRYSMFVEDGIIKKVFIEPMKEGSNLEVSDAETMLNYLAPGTPKPKVVTIFTREGCPFCAKAKSMLQANELNYEEIVIAQHGITNKTLRAISNSKTVPQVFIDGKLIGGSEALESYLKSN